MDKSLEIQEKYNKESKEMDKTVQDVEVEIEAVKKITNSMNFGNEKSR